jgi:hypothetical protein
MATQTNFLLYQAFGLEGVKQEACYSIASLARYVSLSAGLQVCLCTDDPPFFSEWLPREVQLIPLSAQQLKTWRGKKDYLHRIKPEMLKFFSTHHHGNILYCDTDTVFLQSPLPLFDSIESGRLIMHRCEGRIHNQNNALFKKTSRFLRTYAYPGEKVAYDMEMWNAGVMGFNSSQREIFDQILPLLDDLYSNYVRHYMEQVAVSHYFGRRHPLPSEDFIFHYWNFKEFRKVLARFFEKNRGHSFEDWSKKIDEISPMALILPKLKFETKPRWQRQLLKLTGRSWDRDL